ncbi:MAG TPA: Na+/H+ antiporter [Terriglobales bacterium]|nr:Na+/H+ antiporter [Terriglobales bacterium]
MQATGVHAIEIVFLLLLLFVVVFGILAQKLKTPYPIVLVIAGLILSFVPGIPKVTLSPDVIFLVVLPPLLYSAAWVTSWREFSYNLVSIFLLAFGLVTFTVVGVAEAVPWLLPGFDWRVGFVLGAIVAPTDAIAATSIARRIGLPRRLVDILEGESLLNDATALLALEFGIGLLVGGPLPNISEGLLRISYLTVAGTAVGLAIAEIVHQIEHRIDDAPIEIALSILTPYVAYLAANGIHASGVLAVVACGLYLSRKSSHYLSAEVRLQAWAVWDSLAFVLNGLVFVLIGLQLPHVMAAIRGYSRGTLILYGLGFSLLLILLRLLWNFPGAYLAYFVRTRLLHQKERVPPARMIFIVGWTGMRGVVSLAAAIALPQVLADGSQFVQRNMVIFLAFSVILVTLVLQGLTLPPLIRTLGVADVSEHHIEEKEARRAILRAALDHIARSRPAGESESSEVYDDLARHYGHRLATVGDEEADGAAATAQLNFYNQFVDLSSELLHVERQTAVRLRNQRRISDDTLRDLEYEIDLEEARLIAKKRLRDRRDGHKS